MAVPANTVKERSVIEDRIKDILETTLDSLQYMTVDRELEENAGMQKDILVYTYTGEVEEVAEGAGNTERGTVAFTEVPYKVKVKQQVFDYTDEQYMKDPMIVEVGAKGMAQTMKNDMNSDFFTEIAKASQTVTATAFNYDTVVDALEKMNLEDESGLFLIIGSDLKADIRKDQDFKSAQLGQILFDGQVGDICGIPVVHSKKVPANTAFLATKEAVTCFMKKESEAESDRDKEKRINTEILRKVCVVALTDNTKVVKITVSA